MSDIPAGLIVSGVSILALVLYLAYRTGYLQGRAEAYDEGWDAAEKWIACKNRMYTIPTDTDGASGPPRED